MQQRTKVTQEASERLQYAAVSMIRAGAGIAATKHWFLSNSAARLEHL
jgi:hypothetical protein